MLINLGMINLQISDQNKFYTPFGYIAHYMGITNANKFETLANLRNDPPLSEHDSHLWRPEFSKHRASRVNKFIECTRCIHAFRDIHVTDGLSFSESEYAEED